MELYWILMMNIGVSCSIIDCCGLEWAMQFSCMICFDTLFDVRLKVT